MKETLPAKNYLDPGIFEIEQDRIFRSSWHYVGHVEKLVDPGDFFVCEVAGQSLIVARNTSGAISAFHNVCSHRAARLLDGEGCKRRFSCPYHGWTYNMEGELLRAPNAENVAGFNTADYGLKPCAIEEIHGLVFVNLSANPVALNTMAQGLKEELQSYSPNLPELQFVHRTEAMLSANWKVVVENFSECYHCQLIHKEFVNGIVEPESYRIRVHGLWQKHQSTSRTGSGKAYDFEAQKGTYAAEFGAWYLWPNFAFQSYPGGAVHVWKWTPLETGKTHVAVDWYFPDSDLRDWQRDLIRHHAATTFAEDIPLVESVQQGLGSQVYDQGPLMVDEAGSVLSEHGVVAIQDLWQEAMRSQSDGR